MSDNKNQKPVPPVTSIFGGESAPLSAGSRPAAGAMIFTRPHRTPEDLMGARLEEVIMMTNTRKPREPSLYARGEGLFGRPGADNE